MSFSGGDSAKRLGWSCRSCFIFLVVGRNVWVEWDVSNINWSGVMVWWIFDVGVLWLCRVWNCEVVDSGLKLRKGICLQDCCDVVAVDRFSGRLFLNCCCYWIWSCNSGAKFDVQDVMICSVEVKASGRSCCNSARDTWVSKVVDSMRFLVVVSRFGWEFVGFECQ